MTEREKIEIAAIMARCGASEDSIKDAIRDMERQDNSQLRSWTTNYSKAGHMSRRKGHN